MPQENEYEIDWFIAQIKESAGDASVWYDREDLNDRTRWARWPGQSETGKKLAKLLGYDPFPWEGSSDTRVRLGDSICNDMVDIMMQALRNAKIKIVSTGNTGSIKQAALNSQVFQWMILTQMKKELMRELKLAAEWSRQGGLSIVSVVWNQEQALELRELTIDDIVEIVEQDPENRDALIGLQALSDGGSDELAKDFINKLLPDLTDEDVARMVNDLRETGVTEWAQPYLVKNRPCIKTLRCYEDVFFPTNTQEKESCRWWGERDWLTEAQVRDKVNTDGWSEEFVEEVLKKSGDSFLETTRERQRITNFENSVNDWAVLDPKELYEIFYLTYTKVNDEGVPGIYRRVVSGNTPEVDAFGEQLLDYDHGEYQYHDISREKNDRQILLSRGVGEIVFTWQNEKKTMRDYENDAASMSILPPTKVRPSRSDTRLLFGPAAQIPVRNGDDVNFMQPPNDYNGSELVLNHLEKEVKDFFGIYSDDQDRRTLARQNLIDEWLEDVEPIYTQIFALMQQFMDPIDVTMVTGGDPSVVRVDRKMIQGKYQIKLNFDARDLDAEFMGQRMDVISKAVIPLDTDGVIDRSKLAKRLYEWIDPVGAEDIVKPVESVQAEEFDDEQEALAKIWGGVEPPLKEGGVNAKFREQIIMDSIQKNPNIKQRLESDEIYRNMIEARLKNYRFLQEQVDNAEIGKTGTQKALG